MSEIGTNLSKRWDPAIPGDYPAFSAYRLANNSTTLESVPHRYAPLDTFMMAGPLHALADSNRLGFTNVSPEDIASIFLQEQRRDFGAGGSEPTDPNAIMLKQRLMSDPFNYAEREADFAGMVFEKQREANRLGLPFAQVWNGAGPAAESYANRVAQTKSTVVNDPKNAQMLDFFRQNMTDPTTRPQMSLIPIEHDPFNTTTTPVEYDPFGG